MFEVWKNGFFHRGDYTTEAQACASAKALAIDTNSSCDVYTENGEFIATYTVIVCESKSEAERLAKSYQRRMIPPCKAYNEGLIVVCEKH